MKLIRLFIVVELLFLALGELKAQEKEVFDIDLISVDSSKLNYNEPSQFIKNLDINNLKFEEYIEPIPLASGDKIHYYSNSNIKVSVVFFNDKEYLQNITLYSSEHSINISGYSLEIGDNYQKVKKLLPHATVKYNPKNEFNFSGSIFLDINIEENFDYYGKIKIDFKDGIILRIAIGLTQ